MDWRKTVAKEWVTLLIGGGGGFMMWIGLCALIAQPLPDANAMWREYIRVHHRPPGGSDEALKNWYVQEYPYQARFAKTVQRLLNDLMEGERTVWLIMMGPYLLYQLVRSVDWAKKMIRSP